MPKTHNRVRELTTSSGYDNIQLQGAVNGFSSFSSFLIDGDEVYYFLLYNGGYEIGIGTYNDEIISRDTITYSSVNNQKLSLPEGQKTIFCTIPGQYTVTSQTANNHNYIPVFDEENSIVQSDVKVENGGLVFGDLKILPNGNTFKFLYGNEDLDFGGGGNIDINVDTNGSLSFIKLEEDPYGSYNVLSSYPNSGIINNEIIIGSVVTDRNDLRYVNDYNGLTSYDHSRFNNLISSSGNGISVGVDNIISDDSLSIGIFNASIGRASSSFGFGAKVIGKNSSIFGHNSYLTGNNSILFGNNLICSGDNTLFIGNCTRSGASFFKPGGYLSIDTSGIISMKLNSYMNKIDYIDYISSNKIENGSIVYFYDTITNSPYVGYKDNYGKVELETLLDNPIELYIQVNEIGPYEYISEEIDSGNDLIYNDSFDIDFYVSHITSDTRVIQLGSGDITFRTGNMTVVNKNGNYKTQGQYSQVLLSPYGNNLVIISGDLE